MPLEPRQLYSAAIYAEILSSIGASLIDILGPKAALGVFSQVARPVGERDARRLMGVLGAKKGNAASAALVAYAAAYVLDVDVAIDRMDSCLSQVRTNKCIYGDAVLRYKNPLVCALCAEYNKGIAAALGVRFIRHEKMISEGYDSCIGTFEAPAPASTRLPGKMRTDFAIRIIKALYNKNALLVSTLSALLVGLGGRATRILGHNAALIPARGAFKAGAYHGPVFSAALEQSGGAEGAALLVSGVREALGCNVRASFDGGGFSLVTKKCPQAQHCSAGNFLEVACASYARGLLSGRGDFEIKSDITSGVCRQELAVRMQPILSGMAKPKRVFWMGVPARSKDAKRSCKSARRKVRARIRRL